TESNTAKQMHLVTANTICDRTPVVAFRSVLHALASRIIDRGTSSNQPRAQVLALRYVEGQRSERTEVPRARHACTRAYVSDSRPWLRTSASYLGTVVAHLVC